MKVLAQGLPVAWEVCIVLSVCFAAFIVPEVVTAVCHFANVAFPWPWFAKGITLRWLAYYEVTILSVVFCFGRIRGWSLAMLGWQRPGRAIIAVILLFVASAILLAFNVGYVAGITIGLKGTLTWGWLISVSTINPFFEETMELGYVVYALQRYGMWPAVLVSALLRGFLHIHFGLAGMLAIAAAGTVFGLLYWRTRSLWPFFLIHIAADFILLLYRFHS